MNIYRPDGETPWDMPQEIFWDKQPGATVRRAQWVLDTQPDVDIDEIRSALGMQDEEVDQLDFRICKEREQDEIDRILIEQGWYTREERDEIRRKRANKEIAAKNLINFLLGGGGMSNPEEQSQ